MKQFSYNIEYKLHKILSSFMNYETDCKPLTKFKMKLMVMSRDRTMGFIPKTIQAREILRRYVYVEEDIRGGIDFKVPKLEYKKNTNENISARFSNEYLSQSIKIMELTESDNAPSTRLYLNSDYPITLENEHFKIVIAPRIEEE